jgi:DHA2 family multidrug resistance protein
MSAVGHSAQPGRDEFEGPDLTLKGVTLFIAIFVLALANFMAVLDMTIVNVAVQHIAGGLAVAPDQGIWAITSYSIAEAVMVPLSGWLAQRFGAVRVFCVAAIGFGIFSALCGLSDSLGMLVVFRICQGLCGGPLMPMSQTLILRIAPKKMQNMALGLWSMTTIVAPIAGPLLGGTITDGVGWPWAFYINVPIAIACSVFGWRLLSSREVATKKVPVDYVGFVLLVVWVGALQIMLDNGHNWDWFGSPYIIGLCAISVIGFLCFVIWEITDDHPVVDLSLYKSRGFSIASITMAMVFGSFFASLVLVPLWLQQNQGYTATLAGDVVAFNGLFGVIMAPVAATLMSRVDPRLLISMGISIIAATTLYRVGFSSNMGYWQLAIPQLGYGLGMPFFFVPLMSMSVMVVSPDKTATAAGLINFLRSMSGAFATAIVTSVWADEATRQRVQIVGAVNQPGAVLQRLGGTAHHMAPALSMLDRIVETQSVMLATNRTFAYIGLILIAIAIGVWFFPKPAGAVKPVAGH